jgi:hypothetical protein
MACMSDRESAVARSQGVKSGRGTRSATRRPSPRSKIRHVAQLGKVIEAMSVVDELCAAAGAAADQAARALRADDGAKAKLLFDRLASLLSRLARSSSLLSASSVAAAASCELQDHGLFDVPTTPRRTAPARGRSSRAAGS